MLTSSSPEIDQAMYRRARQTCLGGTHRRGAGKAFVGASNLQRAFREWRILFAIGYWNRERERNGRIAAAELCIG